MDDVFIDGRREKLNEDSNAGADTAEELIECSTNHEYKTVSKHNLLSKTQDTSDETGNDLGHPTAFIPEVQNMLNYVVDGITKCEESEMEHLIINNQQCIQNNAIKEHILEPQENVNIHDPVILNSPDVVNRTDSIVLTVDQSVCDRLKLSEEPKEGSDMKDYVNKPILTISKTFKESSLGSNCCLKGCKFSPDGLCLLSNSEDCILRLFEIPSTYSSNTTQDVDPVLKMKEGGVIYDYCWYPKMSSFQPNSCVLASSSSDAPIHLWDAYTGELRCSYEPINQFDELTCAFSLCFTPEGNRLYSGFNKCIKIFETSRPGRESINRSVKRKHDLLSQNSIISCISVNPSEQDLYALGSYDSSIGLYTEPDGDVLCLLKGHKGGVTHLMFSEDGVKLYSGARRDDDILCWDLRMPGEILFRCTRRVETNQRIQFDVSRDGRHLFTGSTDGVVRVFSMSEDSNQLTAVSSNMSHSDCVNGVSLHQDCKLLATASGQRHCVDSDDIEPLSYIVDNTIKLWNIDI